MNWGRLKRVKCPACNFQLNGNTDSQTWSCSSPRCDFRITNRKYNEIMNNIYRNIPRVVEPEDNLTRFDLEEVESYCKADEK